MSQGGESTFPQRPARWTSLLHGATTEAAVVSLVREYLQTWTPSELQAIPVLIEPASLNSGQDVSELAVEVARAEFKFTGEAHIADALREITAVLREAAARFPRFSWEAKLIRPRE